MKNEEKILKKDGVVILKQFYEKKQTNAIIEATKTFIEESKPYNVEPNLSTNFDQLRREEKTIINKRVKSRDGDEGMIDVWNYDKILSEDCRNLIYQKSKQINSFISSTFSCNYQIKTHNLYLNKGIGSTRGIHADSHFFPSRIKSFLFLSDVKDKSYGPFSYIKGTHLGDGIKYHRQYEIYTPLNEKEKNNYTIFDNITAGDLVVACVSGAHRGIPQSKGKERIVLVTSYDPE